MLNPFFTQGTVGEQSLIQDLINEQLRMYGIEVHYMPRSFIGENDVIREVVQSAFTSSYPIEAYIQNYEGYAENPVLLSKFGIEQTQEVVFVISQERWESYIEPLIRDKPDVKLSSRPKEGDLIYLPLGDLLYEIKYVEHEKPFYQLQKNYVYELRCELFRYENEVIDTDIHEIDDNLIGNEIDGKNSDGTSVILGPTQTILVTGIGITATATATIADGGIQLVSITNRGSGYFDNPTVKFSTAPSGGVTGIATTRLIGGINLHDATLGTRSRLVQHVDIVNTGSGYTKAPGVGFDGTGSGAAAVAQIADGVVSSFDITNPGLGYVDQPTITITGDSTVGAAATAVIGEDGQITSINLINAGIGYTEAPTITISDPYMESQGNFIFNEVVTGSETGTTARVRSWSFTNVLDVSNIAGEFKVGEVLTGSESGATHRVLFVDKFPTDDGFADNFNIEAESDNIIDFSENNPFGTP